MPDIFIVLYYCNSYHRSNVPIINLRGYNIFGVFGAESKKQKAKSIWHSFLTFFLYFLAFSFGLSAFSFLTISSS